MEQCNKARVLLAEDESTISNFIKVGMADFGIDVTVVDNGLEAWSTLQAQEQDFKLVILDIRMLGLSGLEVCRKYREKYGYGTPVLMLTALATTDDIVLGLEVGADDYMVKPFKFKELVARVQALMRQPRAQESAPVSFKCGQLSLDPSTRKATREGLSVDLSTKEYRLLEYMIQHHDEPLSRRQLLKDVWDKDFDTNTNIVDVYVRYVRNKIDDPFELKLIHTITGVGYMMSCREPNATSKKK